MLQRQQGGPQLEKIRYVFTNPEGAIANLSYLGEQMNRPELTGRLVAEVFDHAGKRHRVTNQTEALALCNRLKEEKQ